ncbi:MAG: hypothetical protein Q8807_03575, partial ['Waltheria sp.' little leaf phytoplasma]|nr:hypothetical protein ['Waltheria sp.' little leaf phytoplasma]
QNKKVVLIDAEDRIMSKYLDVEFTEPAQQLLHNNNFIQKKRLSIINLTLICVTFPKIPKNYAKDLLSFIIYSS